MSERLLHNCVRIAAFAQALVCLPAGGLPSDSCKEVPPAGCRVAGDMSERWLHNCVQSSVFCASVVVSAGWRPAKATMPKRRQKREGVVSATCRTMCRMRCTRTVPATLHANGAGLCRGGESTNRRPTPFDASQEVQKAWGCCECHLSNVALHAS